MGIFPTDFQAELVKIGFGFISDWYVEYVARQCLANHNT